MSTPPAGSPSVVPPASPSTPPRRSTDEIVKLAPKPRAGSVRSHTARASLQCLFAAYLTSSGARAAGANESSDRDGACFRRAMAGTTSTGTTARRRACGSCPSPTSSRRRRLTRRPRPSRRFWPRRRNRTQIAAPARRLTLAQAAATHRAHVTEGSIVAPTTARQVAQARAAKPLTLIAHLGALAVDSGVYSPGCGCTRATRAASHVPVGAPAPRHGQQQWLQQRSISRGVGTPATGR